jgi:hypothetical protein
VRGQETAGGRLVMYVSEGNNCSDAQQRRRICANFLATTLWLGVVVSAFLRHLRRPWSSC